MMWLALSALLGFDAGVWAPVFVLVGVLITAGASFLVAQRTSSGDVRQTPASRLWEASERIRADLTAEVQERREEIKELTTRLREAETEVGRIKVQLVQAEARIADMERRHD